MRVQVLRECVERGDVDDEGDAELDAERAAALAAYDTNGDGQLDRTERDAMIALADLKTLMSRGDFGSARRYGRWAVRNFVDTSRIVAMSFCEPRSW